MPYRLMLSFLPSQIIPLPIRPGTLNQAQLLLGLGYSTIVLSCPAHPTKLNPSQSRPSQLNPEALWLSGKKMPSFTEGERAPQRIEM